MASRAKMSELRADLLKTAKSKENKNLKEMDELLHSCEPGKLNYEKMNILNKEEIETI